MPYATTCHVITGIREGDLQRNGTFDSMSGVLIQADESPFDQALMREWETRNVAERGKVSEG